MTNNVRIFRIKWLGATNTLGSRQRITDIRFNKSITIDQHGKGIYEAIDYLENLGIKIIGKSEFGYNIDVLFTNNFEVQIK